MIPPKYFPQSLRSASAAEIALIVLLARCGRSRQHTSTQLPIELGYSRTRIGVVVIEHVDRMMPLNGPVNCSLRVFNWCSGLCHAATPQAGLAAVIIDRGHWSGHHVSVISGDERLQMLSLSLCSDSTLTLHTCQLLYCNLFSSLSLSPTTS